MNKQTFITATLGLLLASSIATAATVGKTVDLGTLNTANIGSTYTVGDSFIDTYRFDIASHYSFTVSTTMSINLAGWFEITNLRVRFLDQNNSVITDQYLAASTSYGGQILDLDTYLFRGDDYTFEVSGNIVGPSGGSYVGILQAIPIPEADSYLLMLAGLGLIGIAIRRKVRNHPAGVPV